MALALTTPPTSGDTIIVFSDLNFFFMSEIKTGAAKDYLWNIKNPEFVQHEGLP